MRIVALKQCDAWTPVGRGQPPLAGKQAIWPGVAYDLPDGTEFSAHPPMQKDRGNRPAEKHVSAEQAAKDKLIRFEKTEKVAS